MKRKLLQMISTITLALVMFVLPCLATTLDSSYASETVQLTRTIDTSNNMIDYESAFEQFENVTVETVDSLTTFEGYQTIKMSDLAGIDLVSDAELEDEELSVKYTYTYDSETNLVTLTATLEGDSSEPLIDTIVGAAFVNEAGNIDALLDVDGELMLLSELQDAGVVQNCGWFKNLCKKVSKTVKKVTNTVAGKIGAVLTVAVPVAIGVGLAFTGVGLLATVAIGATAGAAIASGTAAYSTYKQDGKVDWEAVGICAGVGGAIGALASGAAYGITSAVKGAVKSFQSYNAFKKEYGKASSYIKDGEWHHIVEQQTIKNCGNASTGVYNSKNTVAISKNLHKEVSRYYSTYNPTYGMTTRNYINTLPYSQQYSKGLEILKAIAKQMGEKIVWLS